jgi:hypothetical protein
VTQSLVFGGSRSLGHEGRGLLRLLAQGLDVFGGVQFSHSVIFADADKVL